MASLNDLHLKEGEHHTEICLPKGVIKKVGRSPEKLGMGHLTEKPFDRIPFDRKADWPNRRLTERLFDRIAV